MAYAYAFKANNQRHQLPPIGWIQEVWPSMYVNIVLGQGRTTKIGQGEGKKYNVISPPLGMIFAPSGNPFPPFLVN